MFKPKNNLDTTEMCLIWDLKPIPTIEKLTETFYFSPKLLLCADTHCYATLNVAQY